MSVHLGPEAGPPADDTGTRADAAAARVRQRTDRVPRVALILGSGLGDLADAISDPVAIPYAEIPGFPVPSAAGHAGELILGKIQGTPVVAMRGRVHLYEGYSPRQVAFPTRVMRRLGAEVLVATNAAGGLNVSFTTGDVMVFTDHLNLPGMAGQSPLFGPEDPSLGVRFLDLLDAYDGELRAQAHLAARRHGFTLREGVYVMVAGPSYETMAEIRFLQRIGADAVGMSTIPEVLVARHERMRVLALSAITDMAVGAEATAAISHGEVLAAAERIKPRLEAVVRGVVAKL